MGQGVSPLWGVGAKPRLGELRSKRAKPFSPLQGQVTKSILVELAPPYFLMYNL